MCSDIQFVSVEYQVAAAKGKDVDCIGFMRDGGFLVGPIKHYHISRIPSTSGTTPYHQTHITSRIRPTLSFVQKSPPSLGPTLLRAEFEVC